MVLLLFSLLASASPAEWDVHREMIVHGRSVVRLSRTAESDVVGWPDERHERPILVVACEDRKWSITVRTGLRVDAAGDLYDEAFAAAQLRYGDLEWEREYMRRSISGTDLSFRKPKKALPRMLASSSLGFGFTPFASALTQTTFRLDGLEDALRGADVSCALPR